MRARGRACDTRTVSRPPTPLPSEPMLAFDGARRENVMPGGNGRRVAIVAGCRTPFCRAGTVLKDARAVDLARLAARELVHRTNLDGAEVDQVIWGQVVASALVPNVGREVSLLPQFPKAIAEPSTGETMGQSAEKMAKENRISREAQDRWALRSHQLAAQGAADGRLTAEIVPVFPSRPSDPVVTEDNGVRRDTSLEQMAKLKPVFDRRYGSVTAANSSPLTDGASAVLLMSGEAARALGYEPLAYVRSYAIGAVDPGWQLLQAPVFTVPPALERDGVRDCAGAALMPGPALPWEPADGVAIVTFDLKDSPVNKFSRAVKDELIATFTALEQDRAVRAIAVFSGKADNFIAGADIEEFVTIGSAAEAERLAAEGQEMMDRIARFPKPVAVGIHGACLGGGLEFALAWHYRVATDHPKTQLGLPEVQLGILPGAGGCQRLPRLIGARAALDIILAGKSERAPKAFRLGMVDELVHPAILQDVTVAAARRLADGWRPRRRRPGGVLAWLLDRHPLGP